MLGVNLGGELAETGTWDVVPFAFVAFVALFFGGLCIAAEKRGKGGDGR